MADPRVFQDFEVISDAEAKGTQVTLECNSFLKKKDYKALVDKMVDITWRKVNQEPGMEAEDDAITEVLSDYFAGMNEGALDDERLTALQEISRAFGEKRAEYGLQIGVEAEQLRERMKNGEIPGVEMWKEDDAVLGLLAGCYQTRNGEAARKRDAAPQMLQGIFVGADWQYTQWIREWMNEAYEEYLAKAGQMDQNRKYYDLAKDKTPDKAGKFGLIVNDARERETKGYFSEKQIRLSGDELEAYEQKINAQTDQIARMKVLVENISKGAAEDLAKLKTMKKDKHKNSEEYNRMENALADAAALKWANDSYDSIRKKLDILGEAAAKYEKEHAVWYKAGKGYGKDRLDISIHLKDMANAAKERMSADFPDIYKPAKLKGVETYLQKTQAQINARKNEMGINGQKVPEDKEKNQNQRRKLEPEEVNKSLNGESKKPQRRRNNEGAPVKRPEIEKTEHGKNDQMNNNKAMVRKKK